MKNGLQTLNLAFGLFQMRFKTFTQLVRSSRFGHFWKRFDQLILGAIQVFQLLAQANLLGG
jgi:hypothetical protein